MGSTLTNFLFHIVFSTKQRERLLSAAVRRQLYPFMGKAIQKEKGIPIRIGGTEDHVHILCRAHPSVPFSQLAQKIKGSSSRWLASQSWYNNAFSWQRGYAAFSVSQSMADKVEVYIQNQEQHHQKSSFRDELIDMLRKNGIEYDERFLFD